MKGPQQLYERLAVLGIGFDYHEHPPAPTIEEAMKYWKDINATHCKNLFFRNHKGNQHYLVILEHHNALNIHELELKLKQGKLSFASDQRMMKYLGVTPGSVTPLALIHDTEHHVHVFLDARLQDAGKISFHPCINTASLVLNYNDFLKFLGWTQNSWEYISISDL